MSRSAMPMLVIVGLTKRFGSQTVLDETRGHVTNGRVAHFQVTLKIGFTLDDRNKI